jgi:hypothetical protein
MAESENPADLERKLRAVAADTRDPELRAALLMLAKYAAEEASNSENEEVAQIIIVPGTG